MSAKTASRDRFHVLQLTELPAWQLLAGTMESGGARTRAACLGSIASSVICLPFFFFLTSPVVATAAAASCDRSSACPPATTHVTVSFQTKNASARDSLVERTDRAAKQPSSKGQC